MTETKEEIKLCSCCEHRPVAGACIVNGQRRVLTKLCRCCFMGEPEDPDTSRKGRNTIKVRKDDR
jgi:hypothetical protein